MADRLGRGPRGGRAQPVLDGHDEGGQLTAPTRARDLPTATPHVLAQWTAFLQEDARLNGGTASVLLHDGREGLVKVTCCSQVVVTERITGVVEVAVELDRTWRSPAT